MSNEKKMTIHSSSRRMFPELPNSIPMSLLNEEWAQRNHGQALERLDSRGGLGLNEILDNIACRRLTPRAETKENAIELLRIIASHEVAPAAPESREGEDDETFIDADLKKQSIPSLEEIEEMQKAQDGLCKMAGGENTPELAFTSGANWMHERMLRYFAAERQRGEGVGIEEVVRKIFYSPATNGQAEQSIADGIALVSALLDKAREDGATAFADWILDKGYMPVGLHLWCITPGYDIADPNSVNVTSKELFAAFLAGKEGVQKD